jgi:hypothetical protein
LWEAALRTNTSGTQIAGSPCASRAARCSRGRNDLGALNPFGALSAIVVVHFVELTVARRIDPATFPGYARIFGWEWPSTFYAIDIVAWDVFFGLSLLFAVPAFAHRSDATIIRRGLIASGSLCLIGLIGPFADAIACREIGILGYTIVFGLTCLPLSRAFKVDALSN